MTNWTGKRVLVIGAARQGLALARFLAKEGAIVVINDQQSKEKLKSAMDSLQDKKVRWVVGSHPMDLLKDCDLVCLSGGVPLTLPLVQEAVKRNIPLSNDTQVFMDIVPCPVIGITGSAGKTTTTTLVGRMAAAATQSPRKSWVGGNIGNPLVNSIHEMGPNDIVVLELSSFQLEQMTISPSIAAVLNITPNHLDRHGTMEAYSRAKARILDFQTRQGIAILNRQDSGSWNLLPHLKGSLVSFGEMQPTFGEPGTFIQDKMVVYGEGSEIEPILPLSDIQLRGRHNIRNVLAACAIAKAAGFSNTAIQQGAQGFGGVPHRLEFVRELHGARWYNDSIATAPERTMAAIHSFEEPLVVLAGGRDKNLPWEDFARLAHHRVDHIVLFGEAASKIEAALKNPGIDAGRLQTIDSCSTLQEAVQQASSIAEPGDVILLSPGGTSYDEFKDFEERGEEYRKWVQQLS